MGFSFRVIPATRAPSCAATSRIPHCTAFFKLNLNVGDKVCVGAFHGGSACLEVGVKSYKRACVFVPVRESQPKPNTVLVSTLLRW